jgi:TDG/mug DNA glycosylase family protein
MKQVLPDVLSTGLTVVFCGTAASRVSAEAGEYYAHPHNSFWAILHESGLTPERLRPREFENVQSYDIGLTDLIKDSCGSDNEIRSCNSDDRKVLQAKIETFEPTFVAFTSKRAGQKYFGGNVELGEHSARIGRSRVFVLPSTSLNARWQWKETVHHWHAFAEVVRNARGILKVAN